MPKLLNLLKVNTIVNHKIKSRTDSDAIVTIFSSVDFIKSPNNISVSSNQDLSHQTVQICLKVGQIPMLS
jgi:hypothetical protein